jgi:hypothetical protein
VATIGNSACFTWLFIDFFIAMIIASEIWKIIDSKIGDKIIQKSAIVIADEKVFIDSQPWSRDCIE